MFVCLLFSNGKLSCDASREPVGKQKMLMVEIGSLDVLILVGGLVVCSFVCLFVVVFVWFFWGEGVFFRVFFFFFLFFFYDFTRVCAPKSLTNVCVCVLLCH